MIYVLAVLVICLGIYFYIKLDKMKRYYEISFDDMYHRLDQLRKETPLMTKNDKDEIVFTDRNNNEIYNFKLDK